MPAIVPIRPRIVLTCLSVLLVSSFLFSPAEVSASSFQTDDQHGIPASIEIEPGVESSDAETVVESVRFAEMLFATHLGFIPDRPLTVVVNPGEYAPGAGTFGEYEHDQIDIYAGSIPWIGGSGLERVNSVLHEYAHFYLDPDPNPRARPIWLEEGTSEYLSWYLLDVAGLVNNSEILSYYAGHIRFFPPGEELCNLTPSSISGKSYPLAHLGAAVLIETTSIESMQHYREAMVEDANHDDAFLSSFGFTEDEFCATAMASIWSLTPASSLPNDLYRGVVPETGSPIQIDDLAPSAQPGEQMLIQGKAEESANCSLTLDFQAAPAVSMTRESLADGEGDVFWLVTIPPDIPEGSALLTANCGLDADESLLWIAA